MNTLDWCLILKCTLGVYLIVTMMLSFYHPDFIALSIISVGLFGMQHPLYISRRHFRIMTLIVFLSMFGTIWWLYAVNND